MVTEICVYKIDWLPVTCQAGRRSRPAIYIYIYILPERSAVPYHKPKKFCKNVVKKKKKIVVVLYENRRGNIKIYRKIQRYSPVTCVERCVPNTSRQMRSSDANASSMKVPQQFLKETHQWYQIELCYLKDQQYDKKKQKEKHVVLHI